MILPLRSRHHNQPAHVCESNGGPSHQSLVGFSVARRMVEEDVLQLSGLLAGDVKESRNDNPTRDLQMASDRSGLILCAVRWYLRYSLSLRDVEELLEERGLHVDHTTVLALGAVLRTGVGAATCEGNSSRPTSLGERTKPTFA